jgi:hypothetical protein
MVTFFDLVSLFGVAAFFAWLGFAPLQSQMLRSVKPEKKEKARTNLYKIGDYFLVSFIFYSISAVSDYAFHHVSIIPTITSDQRFDLLFLVGISFLFGVLMLFVPIAYVRRIGPDGERLGDIDPPPFYRTLLVTSLAEANTVMWIVEFVLAKTIWGKILFTSSGLASYIMGVWMIKYWHVKYWQFMLEYLVLTNSAWLMLFLLLSIKSFL